MGIACAALSIGRSGPSRSKSPASASAHLKGRGLSHTILTLNLFNPCPYPSRSSISLLFTPSFTSPYLPFSVEAVKGGLHGGGGEGRETMKIPRKPWQIRG